MTDFLSASAPVPSTPSSPPPLLSSSSSFIALSASAALCAAPGSAAANYKVPRAALFASTTTSSSSPPAPFVSVRSGASLFSSASVTCARGGASCDDDNDVLKLALRDVAPAALAGQVPLVSGVAEFRVVGGRGAGEGTLVVAAEEYVGGLLGEVRALQGKREEMERALARAVRVGERTNRRLAERVREGEKEAEAMRVVVRKGEEVRAAQRADAVNFRMSQRRKMVGIGRVLECVARSEVGSSFSGSGGSSVGGRRSAGGSVVDVAMSGLDVVRAKQFCESQVGVGVKGRRASWESKVWITDDESQVTDGTDGTDGTEDEAVDVVDGGKEKC